MQSTQQHQQKALNRKPKITNLNLKITPSLSKGNNMDPSIKKAPLKTRSSSSVAHTAPLKSTTTFNSTKRRSMAPKSVASMESGLNQPSKLFLLLLNTKATLIQRWWRKCRRNAPSHIPDVIVEPSIRVDEIIQDTVSDAVLRRRQAKAEEARLEVLRELELENEKMIKDSLKETPPATATVVHVPDIALAAEPSTEDASILPDTDSAPQTMIEESRQEDTHEEDEPQISYSPVPEPDYLIDLDIQAVNDYYNANQQDEITYEEDFEEFQPDDSEDILRTNVEHIPADIHADSTSTNPEDLDEFLQELDPCDIAAVEEHELSVKVEEPIPATLSEDELPPLAQEKVNTKEEVKVVVFKAPSPVPHPPVPKTPSAKVVAESPRITRSNDIRLEKSGEVTDTTDKSVSRILSFLRSVDAQPVPLPQSHTPAPSIFDDVKHKIMASQLELSEKQKTILALKDQVARLKETYKNDTTDLQAKSRSQLALQRKEYETIVKRHLGFIDTVLAEKETLSAKVVELTEKVTKLEKSFHQKVVGMEESHLKHMTQQKELWQTQERIKRDKWITERTKQIKEQTIQGLEPEIQKLIATHKSALRNAEEEFRNRLQYEKTAMTESFQAQLDKLREKHVSDRQRACEEEREFARERYCKQLEREEMEFQQQKRKMQLELEEERQSWSISSKSQIQDLEAHHRKQIQKLQDSMSSLREEHQKALSDHDSKHHIALNDLKHKLDIEKEEWQSMYMKKTEVQVRAREKAFREQVVRERDAEIEVVIDRLESESGSSNSDATRRYRMDIERIKAETANEIKELRDQHSLALDKLLTANTKTSNLELEIRDLQKQVLKSSHAIMAKDSQIKSLRDQVERLGGDESSVISAIKKEYEEQAASLQEKIEELEASVVLERQKAESTSSQLKQSLANVNKEKEETIKMVEKQVRISLANKDHAIALLKQECHETNQKLGHLEQMMDQQRNELLGL